MPSAPASAGDVLLIPIGIDGDTAGAPSEREALVAEVRRVLDGRMVETAVQGATCRSDDACVRTLLGKSGAEEAAVLDIVRGKGADGTARLRVVQSGQAPTLRYDATLPQSAPAAAVTALLFRAFDPGHHTGTLRVAELGATDVVLVDGLPFVADDPLSVGGHSVVVVRAGRAQAAQHIEVSFAGETVVEPAQPPQRTRLRTSTLAGATTTAVGVVAAVVFGAALPLIDSQERRNAELRAQRIAFTKSTLDPGAVPGGTPWQTGYGPTAQAPTSPAASPTEYAVALALDEGVKRRQDTQWTATVAAAGLALVAGTVTVTSLALARSE